MPIGAHNPAQPDYYLGLHFFGAVVKLTLTSSNNLLLRNQQHGIEPSYARPSQ